MPIERGTRLGPYEIQSPLGAGGMGEVYLARDTRLDRTVAIKVAREEFSERFEREARAVAALNHPRICQLYDVGPNYLVMEYVDGRPLSGPLPLDQALNYAAQIADALDAAHRAGIVHRDLKPSNILVTKGGIKLLDFGLAKVQRPVTADAETIAVTGAGTILGTVQYMSPEQVQGGNADARSDIFSFGLVLYEMLTGKKAFAGSSPASVMAAILERPAPVLEPAGVNRIVSTCLAKNPDDRFQTARDLKRALEWSTASGGDGARPARRAVMRAPWVVAAASLAVAAFGWWPTRTTEVPALDSVALSIAPGANGLGPVEEVNGRPLISPDGRSVVFIDGKRKARLRRLNAIADTVLPIPETAGHLAWSPDSTALAYHDGGNLMKLRIDGGVSERITPITGPSLSVAWGDQGVLYAGVVPTPYIGLVGATGGDIHRLQLPGAGPGLYTWQQFVVGSDDVIVCFQPMGARDMQTYRATLRDGQLADATLLMSNDTCAQYTPAGGGHLLFVKDDVLVARPLAADRRRFSGEPKTIVRQVASFPGYSRGEFSASTDGRLVWRPGRAGGVRLTMFDRSGRVVGTTGPLMSGIFSVRLAPNERWLLAGNVTETWLVEPGQSGKLTVGGPEWATAVWSRDSTKLLLPGNGTLLELPVAAAGANGTPRQIAAAPGLNRLEDLSPDGTTVLFNREPPTSAVFALELGGRGGTGPIEVLGREPTFNTRFSPTGDWIVYEAYPAMNKPGGLFAKPYPGPGLRTQIHNSGILPTWRADGREIVFLDAGQVWSIAVTGTGANLRFGIPQSLFSVDRYSALADLSVLAVTRDGSRFYLPQFVPQPDANVIHVHTGWLKP